MYCYTAVPRIVRVFDGFSGLMDCFTPAAAGSKTSDTRPRDGARAKTDHAINECEGHAAATSWLIARMSRTRTTATRRREETRDQFLIGVVCLRWRPKGFWPEVKWLNRRKQPRRYCVCGPRRVSSRRLLSETRPAAAVYSDYKNIFLTERYRILF